MTRLMIVEPHSSGHRMQYVRWISRGAVAEGYDVELATLPESLDHPLYPIIQEECQHKLRPVFLPDRNNLSNEALLNRSGLFGLLKRELTYHKLYTDFFRGLPREERPDFVFLPYLDYFAYAAALFGSPFGETPWAGIVMRPSFHLEPMNIPGPHSRLDLVKKRLFLHLLKNNSLKRLFSIDEALVRYVDHEQPQLTGHLLYLPDPAELKGTTSRKTARRMFGLSDDATVMLVYGSVTLRKGVAELLRATREGHFPKEVHILLAGRQDHQVKDLLCSPLAVSLRDAGQLHEYDGFLSDEAEYAAFQASDVVWMGYRRHYTMSGVLVQAGMMGLPVVACSEGVIGWLTREYNLGLDVQVNDATAVAKAVSALTRSRDNLAVYAENALRFSAPHTPACFCETIMSESRVTSGKK